ncbi:MAG TPA: GNAT family N-acetyltransferase [Kofleriaceae bacterium]|jgi:ribosomal protein S18 acetylase RimI-like enzyme
MIAVRGATPDDYDTYVRLFPELGVDDPTPTRDRFIAEMIPRTIIATADGAVAGYLLYERMDTTGYIRNVVTAPEHRRKGVGAALMRAAKECFAGAASWALNVKQDNAAAIALYERVGLATAHRTVVTRLPADVVLPLPDPGFSVAPLPPERDAMTERVMKLLPGQLASARKKSGRSVIALTRRSVAVGEGAGAGVANLLGVGELAGVAVMMPIGAFPFRLLDAAHASTFMGLLRPSAAPDAAFVQFSAEDHAALAAELLRLGCEVRMELLHMSGRL